MYNQNRAKNSTKGKRSSWQFRSPTRAYSGHRRASNWKSRNRVQKRENILHTKYISKANTLELSNDYIPEKNFSEFSLHKILLQNLEHMGFARPTKIQDQALPLILAGRDIIGIASTGSGKTGAFLIPLIDKCLKNPAEKVLIVTPTRELATQIGVEFKKFAQNTQLKMALVIGGASSREQIFLLKQNPQFVVATPGRLLDLENRKFINFGGFTNIVLDEVDQMLDMGFINDIKKICAKLATQRQSLFFSATLASREEQLANTLLTNPVKVEAHKQSPLQSIEQDIVKVSSREHKMQILHELLLKAEFAKVLVFSGTKHGADRISTELRKKGILVDSLHGDKSHYKRTRILANFRQNKLDVLVATDVAARGIDIPNITHVINYDEPANFNDYIHRIGRTGRIGKKGTALTFVLQRK